MRICFPFTSRQWQLPVTHWSAPKKLSFMAYILSKKFTVSFHISAMIVLYYVSPYQASRNLHIGYGSSNFLCIYGIDMVY